MKHIIVLFITLMGCLCLNAEVRIQMEKEAGVYKVPCQVNGLKMKFIFDTGAANVSISSTYAEMMLENGYLVESDFKGTTQSILADGSVVDNVVVNLRDVEIAGQTIENVTALIVPSQNAPLLLGQSVIQRLGKVSIDGDYLVIHNASIYSEDEISAIYDKAKELLDNKVYSEALKKFRIVYDFWGEETSPWVLYYMGLCYANLEDNDSAQRCYLKAIELDGGENVDGILFYVYDKLAASTQNHSKEFEYSMLMLKYAKIDIERALAYYSVGASCFFLKKYTESVSYSDKSISAFKIVLKKRELNSYEASFYISSFLGKGWSQEELHRYNEAIETFTSGKKALENYKNEDFYLEMMDCFNEELSYCYNELTKH
ncbi:MAG: retroviral-like aspartic protease family protein [Muribaculaceae bacterium]|nr:retroviral-like aspartic protease family protein [Muribaculaceae bacterium]